MCVQSMWSSGKPTSGLAVIEHSQKYSSTSRELGGCCAAQKWLNIVASIDSSSAAIKFAKHANEMTKQQKNARQLIISPGVWTERMRQKLYFVSLSLINTQVAYMRRVIRPVSSARFHTTGVMVCRIVQCQSSHEQFQVNWRNRIDSELWSYAINRFREFFGFFSPTFLTHFDFFSHPGDLIALTETLRLKAEKYLRCGNNFSIKDFVCRFTYLCWLQLTPSSRNETER